MTLVTRATREIANYILPAGRYVSQLKNCSLSGNRFNVYLTFDDGPDPDHTPLILDQLSQLNAKATFFVLGTKAEQHPELILRAFHEGHSIGTHSWSHPSVNEVSGRIWMEDVVRARRCVEDILGCSVELFRPPYGELTPRTLLSLMGTDVVIVHWSQDPKDFDMVNEQQLADWFRQNRPSPGSVVLMHDSVAMTAKTLFKACSQWFDEVVFEAIPMVQSCCDG